MLALSVGAVLGASALPTAPAGASVATVGRVATAVAASQVDDTEGDGTPADGEFDDTGATEGSSDDTGATDGSTEDTGSTDGSVDGSSDGSSTESTDGSTDDDGSIVENPLGLADDEPQGSTASEDRKIWAVIAGLLLVALALTVITVRYWRQTRPEPSPGGGRRGSKASGGASSDEERPRGRRARTSDEPSTLDDLGNDLFVDD